jgi:hypothetical protein
MKSIAFLGLVFILIIVLTSLLIKQVVEHFSNVDPILTKINTIKDAYKNMYNILEEKKLSDIVPKGIPLKSSVAVRKNIINLGELEKAYKLKIKNSRDIILKRKIFNDTKQEISAFINTYKDLNAQFGLGLPMIDSTPKKPSLTKKISQKSNKKTAQDYEKQFNNQLSMPFHKLNKILSKEIRCQKPNYLNTKKPKTLASEKPPILLKVNKPSVPKPSVPKPSVPKPSVPKPSVPKPSVPKPSVPKSTTYKGPDKSIVKKIRKNIKALFYTPYFD